MPLGGLPYLPFPDVLEEDFVPPVPGDISGGIVAPPGAGSALDQIGALPAPVQPAAFVPPVPGDLVQKPAPLDTSKAATPAIDALPEGSPPVSGASLQPVSLPPPVPIAQREYVRELPLEQIATSVDLEPVPYPAGATAAQKAQIDELNAEQQMIADAGRRAEITQGARTAAIAAEAQLAEDALRQRAAQLEASQERRAQSMKRREEVEAGVDQDYEQLRRLAKEKLPPMSSGDKIALVAVAAAGALNAALNGVQPGQATNTALQQIVNRRATERAQEITGLESATEAGEQQLGMLDRAMQREDYVENLAKAELYEEVALQADAMAKKATSNEERIRLAYAAKDARANAAQSIAAAKQAKIEFQLKLSKEQREEQQAAQKFEMEARKLGLEYAKLAADERAREAERQARAAAQQDKVAEIGKERTIVTPVGDFQVRNPQVAADLTKKLTAGQEMVGLADKIATRRKSQGIEWTKSAEGQKMLADYGKLLLASKNFYELGALAGPDVEVIERVIGGDPNAIISMLPLLEATRENILTEMNLAISSNLVDPAERARFKPWQPAPPQEFKPSAEQATTTIRTGSVEDARGAVEEIISAAKKNNQNTWAETAYRQLEQEKLALQRQRDSASGDERAQIDKKIYAVRQALKQPEAELGRKKSLEIGLQVKKADTTEQQRVSDLQSGLRGIMGVKRSDIGDNPYMDAIRLYRQSDDPGVRDAVLKALQEAGYSDLREFTRRAQ